MAVRLNHPRPGAARGVRREQPARRSAAGCGDAAASRPAPGHRGTAPTRRVGASASATTPVPARAEARRRLHGRLGRLALPPQVELVPHDLEDRVLAVVGRLEEVVDLDAAAGPAPSTRLRAVLACYDQQLAGGGWVAGDRVTAADLHLWAVLVLLSDVPGGGALVEDLDHLRDWSRRLCERHGCLTGAVVAAYSGPHPSG
ncbi:glutathione S-transferase C-terminal domain-containing protein [Georgenia yuyongxinii]